MAHEHKAYRVQIREYTGCVAPHDCNPHSHGAVRELEWCRCGAKRYRNSRYGSVELGPWIEADPDR